MSDEMAASVRAPISFPPDIYRTLEDIALAKKVSMAWVVRDAAELYITLKTAVDAHLPTKTTGKYVCFTLQTLGFGFGGTGILAQCHLVLTHPYRISSILGHNLGMEESLPGGRASVTH